MTDSPDPTDRTAPRKDPSREPPTIDLKATVVDEGARDEMTAAQAERAEGVRPDETTPETAEAAGTDAGSAESSTHRGEDAAPRRAGLGALAGAGLVGGLAGAGLVLAVEAWRKPAAEPDPRVAQLEQRLQSVARQDAVQAIERRLAALEGAQTGLNQRLQAVQGLAEQGAARAEEALNRPLPASPPAPAAPQNAAEITDLANRLAALETQLREGVAQARESAQAAAGATQSLTGTTQSLERRVTEQDERLAALSRQVAEGGSEAMRAGTRALLADRLSDALRTGAPFGDILKGLQRFQTDPARLAALEPYAKDGAPTAAALAQSFEPLSERILRETRPNSDSWSDRLLRMADRIVTIRPVDEPGSDSPSSLVARIRNALSRGAFAEAAAAWDALPEPGRRVSEEWGRQVKQRAAADNAARAIAADAIAALNASTQ